MNRYETNPFQELYVTDSPNPKAFVELFSDFPVTHALALFQSGHVVLKGIQGAGKSMLLNLFRPQIRLAYYTAQAKFPVPREYSNFVGAGINLTRSGALDIGNRPLSKDINQDEMLFPLYFADFLNYYIVRDILNSVEVMHKNSAAFNNIVNDASLDNFAAILAAESCWFGALKGCDSFSELCSLIDKRISAYRAFHLYNIRELPAEIDNTKTNIGEPVSQTAELLRNEKIVPEDTPVFIRIDQVERLYKSDTLRPNIGKLYRQLINKALGLRDSRAWYRVGTRQYAWEDDLRIFGTGDRLEHLRDFRIIDLDGRLKRQEDPKTWIFPKFAEDAFARRLKYAKYEGSNTKDLIRRVFGSTEDPTTAAKNYSKNSSAYRILKLEDFPPVWQTFLEDLYATDPLSAILASAWARQRGSTKTTKARFEEPPPISNQPWNNPYWRKEHIRQALLQIAARAAQRLKWSGQEHILALSAGNISIFLSICHEIWDAFLRSERRRPSDKSINPITDGIHPDVQAVGIQTASTYWYGKITEHVKGDDRRRFLNVIAAEFRSWLVNDTAMSYPGHNGFSIADDELSKYPAIAMFLGDLADYGDLYEVTHTTKEKSRRQRKKWYLSPILSVYYQIPESHVKEPKYLSIKDVVSWVSKANIHLDGLDFDYSRLDRRRNKDKGIDYPTLFDNIPSDNS